MYFNKEETEKQIRQGWIAGLITSSVSLMFFLFIMGDNPNFAESFPLLIEIPLLFGLTFGIYHKSRVAAVIMFAYFTLSRIYFWITFGINPSAAFGMLMIIMFYRGVRGTFSYHENAGLSS